MKIVTLRCDIDLSDSPDLLYLRKLCSEYSTKNEGAFSPFPFNVKVPEARDILVPSEENLRCIPHNPEEINAEELWQALTAKVLNRYCEKIHSALSSLTQEELPFTFAIEHALSLGAIRWVWERGHGKTVVLIFDAHLDAFDLEERAKAGNVTLSGCSLSQDAITSGNFIKFLKGISEDIEIIVVGICEPVSESPLLMDALKRNISNEITLLEAKAFEMRPQEAIGELLDRLKGKHVYLSIDADVSTSETTGAVRYGNLTGMSHSLLLQIAREMGNHLKREAFHLAGVDLCEVFPPLVGVEGDETLNFWSQFFSLIHPRLNFTV